MAYWLRIISFLTVNENAKANNVFKCKTASSFYFLKHPKPTTTFIPGDCNILGSCTLHRNIMSSCCASGDGIPGVTFSVIPETLESPYKDLFPAFENKGLLRTEPGGFVCHQNFAENCHKIYNMKVRSDDVWIRTFPRSGTTWTSELVWLIMNNCDFEGAAKVGLPIRAPSLDANYVNHWDKFAAESAFDTMDFITNDQIEKMPSPRVLKCHLPFYLLPPNLLDTAKVIYVARNPKDAIVSLFYFHKLVNLCTYTGDLEQFVNFFLENKVLWTPYFGTVLDAWDKRSHPNLFILFYEDMKKDIRAQIKRISTFLNKPVTEEQIEKLVDHFRVDKFAKNESVNYTKEIKAGVGKDDPTNTFVRKGQTGDWKNHFSPEVNRKIDAWIEKNLKGTGLKFVTELKDQ